jgi:large subunit ribosomal protein L32e
MKDLKVLLDIRKRLKNKKPDFIRQYAHKKARLGNKWRKPKGLQSKMRLKLKGYRRTVSKGYMGPKATRNLHKSGLSMRIVNTIKDVEKIKKEHEGAVIAGTVGQKKKVEVLKKAKELGVVVLNIKDIDAYLKNVEKIIAEKKKASIKEKETKKEKKVSKKDEKLSEKLQSDDEKKEEEKKDKDKLLTKRT